MLVSSLDTPECLPLGHLRTQWEGGRLPRKKALEAITSADTSSSFASQHVESIGSLLQLLAGAVCPAVAASGRRQPGGGWLTQLAWHKGVLW